MFKIDYYFSIVIRSCLFLGVIVCTSIWTASLGVKHQHGVRPEDLFSCCPTEWKGLHSVKQMVHVLHYTRRNDNFSPQSS